MTVDMKGLLSCGTIVLSVKQAEGRVPHERP
jgi:hypothetical protein